MLFMVYRDILYLYRNIIISKTILLSHISSFKNQENGKMIVYFYLLYPFINIYHILINDK